MSQKGVPPAFVRHLAECADLPLSETRLSQVGELLGQWIPAANALSARMQAADLHGLMPAVVFTPGLVAGDQDGETNRTTRS